MTDPVMLLSQVHGEGRVTFRALRAAGFFSLAGVAEASLHQLSERAHLSVQTARRLKAGAEEMLDRGIGVPGLDEPPAPLPPRARSARFTRFPPKETVRQETGPASFTLSTGVSLEEALLLCQEWDSPPAPFYTRNDTPVPAPQPTPEPEPLQQPGSRLPAMAAAAEVAASLVRLPAPERVAAPPSPAPVEKPAEEPPVNGRFQSGSSGTFWSFG